MPMTIFAGDGFHTRVRDGRVLLVRRPACRDIPSTTRWIPPGSRE